MTEKFIMVYNTFFDSREGSNDFNIDSEELYVYLALNKQQSFLLEEHRISYEFLLDDMNRKNNKTNREKAIRTIESLEQKEVIEIIKQEKTYTTIVFNHLNDDERITTEDSGFYKGFEKLYIGELDKLFITTNYNINDIYLYIMIKAKENNVKGTAAELGYSMIANIMNVSTKTAQNTVARLKDLNLISITSIRIKSDYHESNKYRALDVNEPAKKKEEDIKKKEEEEVNELNKKLPTRSINRLEKDELPVNSEKESEEEKVIEYDNTKKVETKGEAVKKESDQLENEYNKHISKEKELRIKKAAEIRKKEKAKEEVYLKWNM